MNRRSRISSWLLLALAFLLIGNNKTPAASAPPNDNIQNAIEFPGFIGTLSNLTTVGATFVSGEPDILPVLNAGSIWFRYTPSVTTTSIVSALGLTSNGRIRAYEMINSNLTALTTLSRAVTNRIEAGHNYYWTVQDVPTNKISLTYVIRTLLLSKPTGTVSAPRIIDCELTNMEPTLEIQSINVWAQNGELPPTLIASGSEFPFAFKWTNAIAGVGRIFAEAMTTTGERRTSGTNQLTFKSANDNFSAAIDLQPGGGIFDFCTSGSTREAFEPVGPAPGSIWYRWMPNATGAAQFNVPSGAAHSIYSGQFLNSLTRVPMRTVTGTTFYEADVVAGQTYYIALYENSTALRQFQYSVPSFEFSGERTNLLTPGVINLSVGPLPADVESVTYYRGTTLVGTVTLPPFDFPWTNFLSGDWTLTAVAKSTNGGSYFSKAAIYSVRLSNDAYTNAFPLPSDLDFLEMQSSAYLSTVGDFEPLAGVWFGFTPASSGYVIATALTTNLRFSMLDGTNYYSVANNKPLVFLANAGQTYGILTYNLTTPSGFNWSIQNSPLYQTNAIRGRAGQPLTITPIILGPVDHVAKVDYYDNDQLVATATAVPFSGQWNHAFPATGLASLRVTMDSGAVLDGGTVAYTIGPANDYFDDATELPGDVTRHDVTLDQSLAGVEPGEPLNTIRTVWWKWTPQQTGLATLGIDTSGSQRASLVATGDSITNLTLIATNSSFGPALIFLAQAGVTYRIAIGGAYQFNPLRFHLDQETLVLNLPPKLKAPARVSGQSLVASDVFTRIELWKSGALYSALTAPDFEIAFEQPGNYGALQLLATNQNGLKRMGFLTNVVVYPMNDDIAEAIVIPSRTTELFATNSFALAGLEAGEPVEGRSLWWQWTPSASGKTILQGTNSSVSYWNFLVFTGNAFSNFTSVAYVHPVNGQQFDAVAGTTYYICLQNFSESAITWHLVQETLRLELTQRRVPIEIHAVNTDTNETLSSIHVSINGEPSLTLLPPDFKTDWTTNVPGKYLFTALATNELNEVRKTPPVEYWVGPTNDYWADAIDIVDLQGAGNLGMASKEAGETLWYPEATGSVWYKWTARRSGGATVSFTSGGENINGRTSLYEGASISTLRRLNPFYFAQSVSSEVVKDQTYYICITTATGANEPFSFSIIEPPPNDFLADATEISSANLTVFAGTTIGATREAGEEPYFQWNFPNGTVWYRFTAVQTGNLTISIDSASAPIGVGVIYGTNWTMAIPHFPLSALTPGAIGLTARIVEGETYSFWVTGDPGPFSGHLNFVPVAAPPNDFRRKAMLVSGIDVTMPGSLINGTSEIIEPAGYYTSLWYKWVSPGKGRLRFWAEADPAMYVLAYSGGAVTTTHAIGDIEVDAGQFFEFMVAEGARPYAPDFKFRLQLDLFRPPPFNDNFTNRFQIGSASYSMNSTLYGASREESDPTNGFALTTWWELAPQTNGIAVIEVIPAEAADALVYSRVGDTWKLLASGDLLKWRLTNGSPLYISIAGNQAANFTLKVECYYAPPVNDNFANRLPLEGTNISVHAVNYMSSREVNEPIPHFDTNGRTIWWSWFAEDIGSVKLRVKSPVKSIVGVYTGNSFADMVKVWSSPVTSADQTGTFQTSAGAFYHIQLDSVLTEGDFDFTLEHSILPFTTNDNFQQARPIDGGWLTSVASNRGATHESGEPATVPGSNSIWFDWRGMLGGIATITASLPGIPYLPVAVYTGDTLETLQLVTKGMSPLSFLADGTRTYKVVVETTPQQVGEISVAFESGKIWGSYPAGNLLKNGSFEDSNDGVPYWTLEGNFGGHIGDSGGPHGRNWLTISNGSLYQDVATTPGKTYELRFVAKNETDQYWGPAFVTTSFGDQSVGPVEIPRIATWTYTRYLFTASNSVTRVKVAQTGTVLQFDAISVIEFPLNSPPEISTQPASLSAFAGAEAAFTPVLRGTPPFQFQWYHDSGPVPNGTNQSLLLRNVSDADAGTYYLAVTNAFGNAFSQSATLTIHSPTTPVILLQPAGVTAIEGSFVSIAAIAAGTQPLGYQWFKNGQPVAEGTNRNLVIPAAAPADAGTYSLRVSNVGGSALSLPATLNVKPGSGTTLSAFVSNFDVFSAAFAPVFDVDGLTRLSGTNFSAQLYAGVTPETLRPMGRPIPFQKGFNAGKFGRASVDLVGLENEQDFYVQFRAWDAMRGKTYEEARASGGRYAASEIKTFGLYGSLFFQLFDSFSLRAGLSEFAIGKLTMMESAEPGKVRIRLQGQGGARYVVEKNVGNSEWRPIKVFTNTAEGVTDFDDDKLDNGEVAIYRSRIVD